MTLILDLDLDILKLYLHTKNKVYRSRNQKIRAQIKHANTFCSCDLGIDPTTLTYEYDPDILTVYLHTKTEVSTSRLSKVRAQKAQTDATENITTPRLRTVTSSSAMADRPCDCLHPKRSLCSCRHCQWFCAGPARHQRHHSYSLGKKNKDRLAGPAQQLEYVCAMPPCTEHQRTSRSQRFTKEVGHFRRIFDREGGIAHQPVLVSEN